MNARRGLLAILLALSLTLTGCLSLFGSEDVEPQEDEQQQKIDRIVDDKGKQSLEDAASSLPKNFTFPGQQLLPKAVEWFNGTVGRDAMAATEGQGDKGGTSYNGVRVTEDFSRFIPPGQPTEVRIQLAWDGAEAQSADLDIYLDLPGASGHYSHMSEELNWNLAVKTVTVNTIGVQGQDHVIGVEAHNGRNPAGDVEFAMRLEFNYAQEVLTPHHPWAFTVPDNATGVILESVKVAGDEHVKSTFVIIDPDDQVVRLVNYNDLAIPTESIFVPLRQPGEHVFYAYNMTGGFLSVRADAPVEARDARPLETREDYVVDLTGPAPGMVARDWTGDGFATPMAGGQEVTFNVDGAFPLVVKGVINGAVTGATQVRVSGPGGLVHDLHRVVSYGDDRGRVGYTNDHTNQVFNPGSIGQGAYTMQVVNDGPAEVGHYVLTYQR